jgi:hypothetical protein
MRKENRFTVFLIPLGNCEAKLWFTRRMFLMHGNRRAGTFPDFVQNNARG